MLKGDLSTPIYRLSGGDAPLDGRSWTTLDPRTFNNMDEYKIAAGIGDWNTAETLSIGTLKSFEGAVGRTALPIPTSTKPWVPEIRLNGSTTDMIDVQKIIQIQKTTTN